MIFSSVNRVGRVLALVGTVFSAAPAQADMAGAMSDFFSGSGRLVNTTSPGAYKGQSAGYYSGGGIYARTPVRQSQVATLQLPSANAGCGGIDLFAGGFSFINSDELIASMKAIGNNALSLAFMLGIETISPIIAEKIEDIRNLQQAVNSADINSCETAAALVGNVWSQLDLASAETCASIGAKYGMFADHLAAGKACSSQNVREGVLNNPPAEFADLTTANTNFAWNAIVKSKIAGTPGSNFDKQLAELMMTVSGTVIRTTGTAENDGGTFQKFAGAAGNSELLTGLLDGTRPITILRCDTEDKCLNVSEQTVSLGEAQGFYGRVKQQIASLRDAVVTDKELTSAQTGFLNATSFPLYKLLNVYSSYAPSAVLTEQEQLTEVIAMDILSTYLRGMLEDVSSATRQVDALKNNGDLDAFQKGLAEASSDLDRVDRKTAARADMAIKLIERTRFIEGILAQQFTGRLAASVPATGG